MHVNYHMDMYSVLIKRRVVHFYIFFIEYLQLVPGKSPHPMVKDKHIVCLFVFIRKISGSKATPIKSKKEYVRQSDVLGFKEIGLHYAIPFFNLGYPNLFNSDRLF